MQRNAWIVIVIAIAGLFFSVLIPPLQSPDEKDHLKRAYLLTQNQLLLTAPSGHQSGGWIDEGLLTYSATQETLSGKFDRKLSDSEQDLAKNIQWTGHRIFSEAPGTGYYFPVIYLPQAMGLALGEKLGLTVDASYQLARYAAIFAITGILLTAFSIYPTNPLTIALLLLPMTIFQFVSSGLDGISTALIILVISLFLKINLLRDQSRPALFNTLAICTALLITSRIHLLPLLGLLLVSSIQTRRRINFCIFSIAVLCVAAWLLVAIKTTVDTRSLATARPVDVLSFYIHNPKNLLHVFSETLSNPLTLKFYRESFLGVLGSLDAYFPPRTYFYLTALLGVTALLSIFWSQAERWPRALLLGTALASTLLVFLALLFTWTPHPASRITGIQGRYFLAPAILTAYAISGRFNWQPGIRRTLIFALIALTAALTVTATTTLLIRRYYMPLQTTLPDVTMQVLPSPPLRPQEPLPLHLDETRFRAPYVVTRVGILFGTYGRKNEGMAALRLNTADGRVVTRKFDLSHLSDNRYEYFEVDPLPYVKGELDFVSGGGVSTWQIERSTGPLETCMAFEYAGGMERHSQGCPQP